MDFEATFSIQRAKQRRRQGLEGHLQEMCGRGISQGDICLAASVAHRIERRLFGKIMNGFRSSEFRNSTSRTEKGARPPSGNCGRGITPGNLSLTASVVQASTTRYADETEIEKELCVSTRSCALPHGRPDFISIFSTLLRSRPAVRAVALSKYQKHEVSVI